MRAPVATENELETPSADLERETAELLETCCQWIQRFIVVSGDQKAILAAWILHTWTFEAGDITPYLHITAPERECGKSDLMRAVAVVSACPVRSGGMTAAALVRCIDAKKPTIFLDEMDAQFRGDKEYAETLRGILNEGFQRDGQFMKCDGKSNELRDFNVYCPKCFAGIGQLPETVSSRSIVIEMRRKTDQEKVEQLRSRAVRECSRPIRARLESWKKRGAESQLERIRPDPLQGLGARQNDIAEPLLCVGTLAGPVWLQRLSDALIVVLKGAPSENVSIGVTLLTDIRSIFNDLNTDRVTSEALAERLCGIEGRPWAEWSHGKCLTPNNLARQLAKYRIHPGKVRIGSKTFQGYMREVFNDTWERYCPVPPRFNRNTGTIRVIIG
jgi:hypothetical protein